MTSQEFETGLGKGKIPLVCYLYGEESFLVERGGRLLLDRSLDHSLKDFNLNVFYGNETKGIDVVDAAQTLPMFAERRTVVVKRAEALSAPACEVLLSYIQKPSPSTCLLFTGTKIDLRKKFCQELKKQGALVEYKRMYDNKLAGFIQGEAKVQGKMIEGAAAELLAFLIGNNLQELSSQIEKLVVFCAEKPAITVDDVRTVASSSKAFTAFELARFVGLRDMKSALRSMNMLFRNGEDAPLMIGALTRHLRQLWRIRELLDQKRPQADIGKELNIHAFFLGELVQQARNFGRNDLRRLFSELYRCDVASKSGGHPYTLMHGLVVDICSGVH